MRSGRGDGHLRPPGFPIRTPSDHSSVDNSPRTIAASHVLHRLLMPRHPPCALTHLTTTRCSHPLCNTQHTTTPQTPDTTTPTTKRNALDARPGGGPENNTHTGVSSGPNSVPSHRPRRPEHVRTKQQKCSTQPHPQPATETVTDCLIRRGISERRDTHPSEVHAPTSPNGETP